MSDEPRRPASRLKILGAIALVAIVGSVIIAIVVPGITRSSWVSNEHMAAFHLKVLAQAEREFRSNDLDWNHVNDYWTGDVKGLYTLTSAARRGATRGSTTDPALKLINLNAALADAEDSTLPAGGENTPLDWYGVPSAAAGYWIAAMTRDASTAPGKGDPVYRQDTGGEPPMGPCHHLHRYGFLSFPNTPRSGSTAFIINQDEVIYRIDAGQKALGGDGSHPPGVGQLPPMWLVWPAEADLKKSWTRLD